MPRYVDMTGFSMIAYRYPTQEEEVAISDKCRKEFGSVDLRDHHVILECDSPCSQISQRMDARFRQLRASSLRSKEHEAGLVEL